MPLLFRAAYGNLTNPIATENSMKTATTLMAAILFTPLASAAELPPLDHQQVVEFQAAGENLVANGSFELGLGAEPFYPGWNMPTRGNLPTDAPEPPVLDSPGANGSKLCLKIGGVTGGKHAYIDLSPPPVGSFPGARHFVSVWMRASCAKAELSISMENSEAPGFGSRHFTIGPTWRQYVFDTTVAESLAKSSGWIPHVRIEAWTSDGSPFDVWFDDIQWSQSAAPKNSGRAPLPGPVDVVLLPKYRTGIYPANEPAELTWSAEAARPRNCQMELHLLDVSRAPLVPGTDSTFATPWRQTVVLESHPSSGKIPLGNLKRGSYMALLAVRDATSGELLGVARERFSVMANLRTRPAPMGFNAGTWGGLRGWGDAGPDYHWRGYWSTDEYYELCYQTGFRTQRLLANWESIEPVQGKRDWIFKTELDLAKKHDCETILCFPENWPRLLEKPKYQELLKAPDLSQGKWLYKLGRNIESELDGWPVWPENRGKYVLIAPPVEELKSLTAELAAIVRGKVACLEVQNESNIILGPRALGNGLLQYMYPIMKKLAPDTNVLFNVTLDYQGNGHSFIDRYFAAEVSSGQSFCDGFTFHPYERRDLQAGGKTLICDYARKLPYYSLKLKKPLVYGQDEVDTLGSDWDYMQRFLIDWSGGCRWSAGETLDLASFYEVGTKSSWRRRGTFVPGPPSVALNAMYDVLAGMHVTGQAEYGDKILCALLQSQDGSRYAAALCAANRPGHLALINAAGLSHLSASAFDMWGEPTKVPEPLIVGPQVIYLTSTDARLHDCLRTATSAWHQAVSGVKQMNLDPKSRTVADFRQGGPETRYLLRTGMSRYLDQGVAWTEWSVKGSSDDSKTAPLEAGLATATGDLVGEGNVRVPSNSPPLLALANAGIALTPGNNTWWLHGNFISRDDTILQLNLGWTGADEVSAWVDGKQIASIPSDFHGVIGDTWLELSPVPVAHGLHNVVLRLHRNGDILKIAVRTGCVPSVSLPVDSAHASGVYGSQNVAVSKNEVFSGATLAFGGGDYLWTDLEARGFGRSLAPLFLRVPPGCKATLFSEDCFSGRRTTYATGIHHLGPYAVRSIKVRPSAIGSN